jgi:hypothetical protein
MADIFNMTDTWNNAGTAFTAVKMNVTNTASASGSKYLDIQHDSASVFEVLKNTSGNGTGIKITAATPDSQTLEITPRDGAFGQATYRTGGTSHLFDGPVYGVGIITAASLGGNQVIQVADASDVLAIRNSTTAQTFRVYNTWTDASNYERGIFSWSANVLTIGTQAAGTGTARGLSLLTADGTLTITDGSSSPTFTILSSNRLQANQSFYVAASLGAQVFQDNSAGDISLSRAANKVWAVGSGAAASVDGWFHYAGQKRVTSDFSKTSDTTLANVTGLTVDVAAGRTYSFETELSFTCAAAGGVKAAIAGTATATNIIYDGWIVDSGANGIKGNAQATALGGTVASAATTGTAGHILIRGTITVNAAGTLTVQFAQNTTNGTASVAKRGSYFIVYDMP